MKLIQGCINKTGWHLSGDVPIQLGAKIGVQETGNRHIHKTMTEHFVILQGWVELEVDGHNHHLGTGDLCVVEPGEAHRILSRSPDAHYLLLMPPYVANDKSIYSRDLTRHFYSGALA
jgi:mannose-6-phosphate isomerase-like protein (cupin superfamily)